MLQLIDQFLVNPTIFLFFDNYLNCKLLIKELFFSWNKKDFWNFFLFKSLNEQFFDFETENFLEEIYFTTNNWDIFNLKTEFLVTNIEEYKINLILYEINFIEKIVYHINIFSFILYSIFFF